MSDLVVIFLDIDGPLIPHRAWAMNRRRGATSTVQFFDQCAMAVLMEAMDKTGAQLVLSSSWRYQGWDRVARRFSLNEVPSTRFHKDWRTTVQLEGGADRAGEILEWVYRHNPVRWAAVDDSDLRVAHLAGGPSIPGEHFVKCTMEDGLGYAQQQRLLNLLGAELGVEDPRV